MATLKRRSKAKVYIYRVFVLSTLAALSYGAYQGYQYVHPTVSIDTPVQLTSQQSRELEAIQSSASFKAKIANLAEQQLLSNKIEQKQSAILQLQNEVATIKGELETKRVQSLSL